MLRVWGLGFGEGLGLGFGVQGLGLRAWGLGCSRALAFILLRAEGAERLGLKRAQESYGSFLVVQ